MSPRIWVSLHLVDVVLSLHGRVATAIVLYLSIVGLWGLWLGLRGSGPTPSFIGALVIFEVAAIAQGLFGIALLFSRAPSQSLSRSPSRWPRRWCAGARGGRPR